LALVGVSRRMRITPGPRLRLRGCVVLVSVVISVLSLSCSCAGEARWHRRFWALSPLAIEVRRTAGRWVEDAAGPVIAASDRGVDRRIACRWACARWLRPCPWTRWRVARAFVQRSGTACPFARGMITGMPRGENFPRRYSDAQRAALLGAHEAGMTSVEVAARARAGDLEGPGGPLEAFDVQPVYVRLLLSRTRRRREMEDPATIEQLHRRLVRAVRHGLRVARRTADVAAERKLEDLLAVLEPAALTRRPRREPRPLIGPGAMANPDRQVLRKVGRPQAVSPPAPDEGWGDVSSIDPYWRRQLGLEETRRKR
jgi:hypothetical protein